MGTLLSERGPDQVRARIKVSPLGGISRPDHVVLRVFVYSPNLSEISFCRISQAEHMVSSAFLCLWLSPRQPSLSPFWTFLSGVTSTTPPSLYVPRTRTSDTNIQLHEIIKCCHAEYILSLHDSLRSAYHSSGRLAMGRGGLFEKNIHPRERPNLWLMVFRFHPPYNEGTVEFFYPPIR